MSKNRSHGKIDRYPEKLRAEVENRLLEGHTHEEIAEYLRNMGKEISSSSVRRYGLDYLNKFEAVRMAREAARRIAEDNPDRPTTELHEANNALISQIIMGMMVDEDMSERDKLKAAQSICALQAAQVRNEKLKIDARKAGGEVKAAMNSLKAKVFEAIGKDYPEIAAEIIRIAEESSEQ